MAKYKNVPVERREAHRWKDISEYLDGKISREQLRKREEGAEAPEPERSSRSSDKRVRIVHAKDSISFR